MGLQTLVSVLKRLPDLICAIVFECFCVWCIYVVKYYKRVFCAGHEKG